MSPLQPLPGEMIARTSSHGVLSLREVARTLCMYPNGAG